MDEEKDGFYKEWMEGKKLVMKEGKNKRVEGGERLVNKENGREGWKREGKKEELMNKEGKIKKIEGGKIMKEEELKMMERIVKKLLIENKGDLKKEGKILIEDKKWKKKKMLEKNGEKIGEKKEKCWEVRF